MKIILSLIVVTIFLAIVSAIFLFKGKELQESSHIKQISVVYNEALADLLPDDHEPKEFIITEKKEIDIIREKMGNLTIAKIQTVNSEDMDVGKNWIVNIYYHNGDFTYFNVDVKQVAGNKEESSKLYNYLLKKYI